MHATGLLRMEHKLQRGDSQFYLPLLSTGLLLAVSRWLPARHWHGAGKNVQSLSNISQSCTKQEGVVLLFYNITHSIVT